VKSSRQWISYSLLRLGLFAAVLAVLLLLQIEPWIAAVIAAVVGLCVGYIFFRPQREAVTRSLWDLRHSPKSDSDAEAENEAMDASAARSEGERGGEPDPEEQGSQAR